MDLTTVILLCAAGLAGGTIASLAGGAALITFPTLLAAGLSPVVATASNLAALMPGSFLAALSDRTQLPPLNRDFVGLVFASIVGAAVGALLLMVTSNRVFELLVPLLLGFATIMFAFGERISAVLLARSTAAESVEPHLQEPHLQEPHFHEPRFKVTSIPLLLPVSIYGGYFGAGVGVLTVAVLSIATSGEYRPANAAKNLVTAFNGLAATIVFAVQGGIDWPATLAMMSGALVGSLIGARVARYAPREIMRWVVVIIGAVLTAVYAWRYWF